MEVCTIIAKNYLAPARVLARSLAHHNPGSRLWTLIIDDFERYIDPAEEPFEVLTPADIDCEAFTYMALRYSVLELSTAVKPWLLRYLMGRTGQTVTYLDPDIKVYGSLQRLDELAREHGVVLIPHNDDPIPSDGHVPTQVDIMIAGVYNLGYLSVAPRSEVERMLDWWADRLRRDCRVDPRWGYFVDQRWFDLVPGFLTDFAIVREPEYNVAYWNLHSRCFEYDGRQYLVNGRPLAFFHFSGFDAMRPLALSRYQDRINVASHPSLERLLGEYAREVVAEGYPVSRNWPYGYRALGDGTEIDDLVRSFCEEFEDDHAARGLTPESLFTPAGAQALAAWLAEDAPAAPPGINRVLARLYERRSDLQLAFPEVGGADRTRLLTWAVEVGRHESPLLDRVLGMTAGGGSDEAEVTRRAVRRAVDKMPDGPWGVNVVGYFHSSTEMGEAARQLVSAFDQAGIPAAPVQDWTSPLIEEGQPYAALPPERAPYVVNLLCLPAEALPEFAKQAGERFFAGRYSIGLWARDDAPSAGSFDQLQEIWVPNDYVAEAVTRVAPVPVFSVPVPVEPESSDGDSCSQIGLPPNRYLFATTLECGDEFDRKNPVGVVEAFGRAFGEEDAIQLVIGVHPQRDDRAVEAIRSAAVGNSRISVIELAASRRSIMALLGACDCYVSLHRGELFGFTLAQAMWIGKPVVATRYAASLDFMTDANSLLVDCEVARLTTSRPGDRPKCWVEPDLAHAALRLRQAFGDAGAASSIGAQAARDIRLSHSTDASVNAIKQRLEVIRVSGRVPPAIRAGRRSPTMTHLRLKVDSGPPEGPRGGPHTRLRGAVRKLVLRGLRPYTAYQESVNRNLVEALDLREEAVSVEQAQLLAELRSSRQLRRAVIATARGLDDLARRVALQSDRALYLALGELERRHALVSSRPGELPSSLGLTSYELRGYSQNGEDGVLAEILRRIGAANRYFVEFGVESGIEGNCVYLADVRGWDGVFMEADRQLYRLLAQKYEPRRGVRTMHAKVTPDNVTRLLADAEAPVDPDVMSIDVDGADYWIWEALTDYRPRVLVIEYNSALDPRRQLVQPPEPEGWDGTAYFGASLGALRSLGDRKGYRLVHVELAGANAFLVPAELAQGRFPDSDRLLLRGRPNYYQSGHGHPPDTKARQYLDLETGRMVSP